MAANPALVVAQSRVGSALQKGQRMLIGLTVRVGGIEVFIRASRRLPSIFQDHLLAVTL